MKRKRYEITSQAELRNMKTKRQIVCEVLDLNTGECSHGDAEYVAGFEKLFGSLTEENFRKHCGDSDFTNWAMERGY